MNWFLNNCEWIFSGIGVFVIGLIITIFRKKKKKNFSQYQKSGKNSINIQASRDITFGDKKKNE